MGSVGAEGQWRYQGFVEEEEVTGHSMKSTGAGEGDDREPDPAQCLPAVQEVLEDPGK